MTVDDNQEVLELDAEAVCLDGALHTFEFLDYFSDGEAKVNAVFYCKGCLKLSCLSAAMLKEFGVQLSQHNREASVSDLVTK